MSLTGLSRMKAALKGLCLVELLITVSIIIILASIAIPNFEILIAQNRLENQIARLFKSLYLARHYAVSHSTYVTLCPLVNNRCQKNWNKPIMVFIDQNLDLTLDSNEAILFEIESTFHEDNLTYPRLAITYRPDASINFMQSGSFLYCNPLHPRLKGNRLTVSQVGRIRVRDSEMCKN